MRIRTLVISSLLSTVLAAQPPVTTPPPDHHLVEVYIKDAATLDKLLKLDLDLAGCNALDIPAKSVDVIATDADIDKLTRAGLDFDIAIRNVEDHYERELAKDRGVGNPLDLTPPVGQGGMGGHYTLAQMEAILDTFVRNHPTICSKTSIGRSIEGRNIWMVKISDNVQRDENEPEVYYDAIHHAREPLGMTTLLQFMDWVLTNYTRNNAIARTIVNGRELYCVPCVNPDGYEYNRRIRPGGGGMWRKNRRNNGRGIYGVDLNRNYTTGWSAPYGGNSRNPSSSTYRGTAPFSEPETAAIRDFWRNRKFFHVFSCHTYTEVLLRPWGYQRGNPPNANEYAQLGAQLTSQNRMRHGAASTLLYIAAGTTLDHGHVAQKAYGWTPELGTRSEGGFWPNRTNQVRIANRHQHMFQQVALTARANVPGAYRTFGTGCRGSNGFNPLLTVVGPPKLGDLFSVSVSRAAPLVPATLLLGGSKTRWQGLQLPFRLDSFGAPGCAILASGEAQLGASTSVIGIGSRTFRIPNDEALVGVEFHNQWVVLDRTANVLGIAQSQGGTGTIGNQ